MPALARSVPGGWARIEVEVRPILAGHSALVYVVYFDAAAAARTRNFFGVIASVRFILRRARVSSGAANVEATPRLRLRPVRPRDARNPQPPSACHS